VFPFTGNSYVTEVGMTDVAVEKRTRATVAQRTATPLRELVATTERGHLLSFGGVLQATKGLIGHRSTRLHQSTVGGLRRELSQAAGKPSQT
jgi:hypothetical protein